MPADESRKTPAAIERLDPGARLTLYSYVRGCKSLAGFRLQATGESFGAGPKKLKKVSPGEIAIVSGGLVAANAPEDPE